MMCMIYIPKYYARYARLSSKNRPALKDWTFELEQIEGG